MTPIITPDLVRRYLIATGWTVEPIEDRLAWTRPDGSSCWSSLGCVPVMLAAAPPLRADEYGARLGMLAAAEDLLERSREYFASGDSLLGTSKAADGYRFLATIGVDPGAWEKAREQ